MAEVYDKESENFFRLASLLIEQGTLCLRKEFDKLVCPSGFPQWLENYKEHLKKVFGKGNFLFKQLYPEDGRLVPKSSEQFDLTLLCALLKALLPRSENSLLSTVDGLRVERNVLYGHTVDCRINDDKFMEEKEKISMLFKQLNYSDADIEKWFISDLTPARTRSLKDEIERQFKRDESAINSIAQHIVHAVELQHGDIKNLLEIVIRAEEQQTIKDDQSVETSWSSGYLFRLGDCLKNCIDPDFGLTDGLVRGKLLTYDDVQTISNRLLHSSYCQRNQKLLSLLSVKSVDNEDVHTTLTAALTQSKQQHVVNYINSDGAGEATTFDGVWPLAPADLDTIDCNACSLCGLIDLGGGFLDGLEAVECIRHSQREYVETYPGASRQKVMELLSILRRRSLAHLEKFIVELQRQEKYKPIAEIFKEHSVFARLKAIFPKSKVDIEPRILNRFAQNFIGWLIRVPDVILSYILEGNSIEMYFTLKTSSGLQWLFEQYTTKHLQIIMAKYFTSLLDDEQDVELEEIVWDPDDYNRCVQFFEERNPSRPINTHATDIDDDTDVLDVKVLLTSEDFYRNHYESAYSVYRKCRGTACIINIFKTIGMSDRRGTDVDCNRLDKLFGQLHFNVKVYNDNDGLTAEGILEKIAETSNEKFEGKWPQCYVLFILSHGGRKEIGGCETEVVFGTDGKPLSKKRIMSVLSDASCSNLQRVPRLIFFQSCRGETLGLREETDTAETRQVQGDFLMCHPCQQVDGSRYVRCLVDVFMNNAHDTHVIDLLTALHEKLESLIVADKRHQIPELTSSLRKKFFFFPGYVE